MNYILRLCRWDAPTGALFLFWPTLWGLLLGAQGRPQAQHIILCALGCWLMRSAGCVYNDWVDRDLDRHVQRTAQRPLASGALSGRQAVVILVFLLCAGVLILLSLNKAAVVMSLAAVPLVVLYPWMKRWTYWPQAFLGVTFNWGLLVGYAIETNRICSSLILPWYVFGLLWTILYDTIYAHQDIHDDHRMGIKSSALALKHHTKTGSYILLGLMLVCAGLGHRACGINVSDVFAIVMVLGVGISVHAVPLDQPSACAAWFKKNAWWGAWMSLGLAMSYRFCA